MVHLSNVGVTTQMTCPLLAGSVDEELEAVRVDLVVYIAAHLRQEGISATLWESCHGDIIH